MDLFQYTEFNKIKGSAKELVLRKAHQMTVAFESIPFQIKTEDGLLSRAMDLSDFEMVRSEMAMRVSLEGKAAIGLVAYYDALKQRQTYIAVPFSVAYWYSIGSQENRVICRTTETIMIPSSKKAVNVYAEYFWYEATPESTPVAAMRKIYLFDDEFTDPFNKDNIREIDITTFPNLKTLPVKIFKNNTSMVNDVLEFGVGESLKNLSTLSEDILPQYYRSRNILYANQVYTDISADIIGDEIDEGRSSIDEHSSNAKAGSSLSMMSNQTGITLAIATHTFFHDRVSTMLGLSTADDQTKMQSGAQKHSLQIVLSDQFSISVVLKKFNQRKKEWTDFFNKWCLLLGVAIDDPELKPDELLQAKIAYLKASINVADNRSVNNMQGQLQAQEQTQTAAADAQIGGNE